MLAAKLFGIAAVAIALIAFRMHAAFDLYLHDTYFVVSHGQGILSFALLCAVFAALYYFGGRFLGSSLSKGLALAHFLLWVFALVAFSIMEFLLIHAVQARQDPNQSWPILAGSAVPALAFLAGGLLFLLNFALAIARKLRTS
jgi:heme/copper-type cytochrome/quinol oxidase subunit 1